MSILDAYGDFDLPEEKSVIEVVEDPVKTVLASYDLYTESIKEIMHFHGMKFVKKLYFEAAKIFEGRKINVDEKQIKEIIKMLMTKEVVLKEWWLQSIPKGVFLSAVHNFSSLETLVVEEFSDSSILGENLKPDKKLILGPAVNADYVGENAEGIILNYGYAMFFCHGTKGGVHVNKSEKSHTTWPWTAGIRITNYEKCYRYLGENGLIMKGCGFLLVPHKSNTRLKFEYTDSRIIFRELNTIKGEPIMENKIPHVPYNSKPPVDKINSTLNTPELLTLIQDDSFSNWQNLLQKISSFDWQKLQNDLADICEKQIDYMLINVYRKT